MIGEWKGECKIIVSWCEQDRLAFHLIIGSDGRVEGSIGDASIADGSVSKNSWFLARLGKPQYIIEATLDGSIVATEEIHRESITLLVDIDDAELEGGFRTSGSKLGGKETMAMSGSSLRLTKIKRLDSEISEIGMLQLVGQERIGDG